MDTYLWQTQTVQTFFGTFSWAGSRSQAAPTILAPEDWRKLSVKAFFSTISWKTSALSVLPGSEGSQSFSLDMSVRNFLRCIVWEGSPHIGVIPKFAPPTSNTELSLSDLSDLF
ncbi:MAG TPA: hypothetical protein V6D19_09120 [Stenomitos sp.]